MFYSLRSYRWAYLRLRVHRNFHDQDGWIHSPHNWKSIITCCFFLWLSHDTQSVNRVIKSAIRNSESLLISSEFPRPRHFERKLPTDQRKRQRLDNKGFVGEQRSLWLAGVSVREQRPFYVTSHRETLKIRLIIGIFKKRSKFGKSGNGGNRYEKRSVYRQSGAGWQPCTLLTLRVTMTSSIF